MFTGPASRQGRKRVLPNSNQQLLLSNSGALGSDPNLTWNNIKDTLTVGNSSVNAVVNSTAVYIGNTGGAISTGSALLVIGNTSVNIAVNSTTLSISSISATTVGVQATNSSITIGNSSVNSSINSTSFTETGATTNGCLILANGWKLQFGLVQTSASTGNAVTFASAYVTNAYGVVITPAFNTVGSVISTHANAVTKTGMTVFTTNSTALITSNAYWMTIGQ